MARPFGCGKFTVVGPVGGKPDACGHKRLLCDSLRCPHCRTKRVKFVRSRIAELAEKYQLKRFVTLTLDPKRVPPGQRSDRYLRNCWRKMRVSLQRKFGESIRFIAVLEYQKSGMAHLHFLVGVYIPQDWLSEAWQAIGGGVVVDIRYVDIHRVVAYVTPYLTGGKIEHTLGLLHPRARIFSTSRGLSLSQKTKNLGWWLNRVSMESVHRFCPNPSEEKFEEFQSGDSRLSYFEGLPTIASIGDLDVVSVLKRMARAQTKPQEEGERGG
jgi:hypothetical protein